MLLPQPSMWWDSRTGPPLSAPNSCGKLAIGVCLLTESNLAKFVSIIFKNQLLVSLIFFLDCIPNLFLSFFLGPIFPCIDCSVSIFVCVFVCLGWKWAFGEPGLWQAISTTLMKAPRDCHFCVLSMGRLGKFWLGARASILKESVETGSDPESLWLSVSWPLCAHSEAACVLLSRVLIYLPAVSFSTYK